MTTEILEWLRDKRIVLCEGQPYTGDWEETFIDFMKEHEIPLEVKTNLYEEPVDLSVYDIIAFATTATYYDKVRKLMEFDTSNLKGVITIEEWAFDLVEKKADELQIPVIGFDNFIAEKRDDWMKDEVENIFFDPNKKWRY